MENESRGTSGVATVSQTAGPFFHIGLEWLFSERVVEADAPGLHIAIEGRVLDGAGAPVSDALIEVWQADGNGRYARGHTQQADQQPDRQADPKDAQQASPVSPGFRGFARVPTSNDGGFRLATIKPGRVPAPGGGLQAPHILVALFMRGLLRHAVTRIYFADEPSNEEDLVLGRVPASRRSTLTARPKPGTPKIFEWNIIMQGLHETVFFDY